MKVAVVNGSGTAPSSNDAIVSAFVERLSAVGAESSILNVYESGIPLLVDENHPSVISARQLVADSDVIVLITPLYHGSFSGLLKLFLDQLDRDAFSSKRVVLVSNSSKSRNAQAAAQELIQVIWTMKGSVHRLVGACSSDFEKNEEGLRILIDQEILDRITQISQELANGIAR